MGGDCMEQNRVAIYLVTGGAGFIGSTVVHELVRRGEQVRVIDNFLTGHRHNLVDVLHRIELYVSDITDLVQIREAFRGTDYVLHLAALASVPRSLEDPVTTNRINTDGTLNALVAARDARVKRLVYASSSSAYGNCPETVKTESMSPQPLSPYAASKLAGENYCRIFSDVYGLETVCLRYFNVFGPRQDPGSPYSGVLSRFIRALLEGDRPVIFGDGEQSRDFTFVDDVVEANLRACTAPAAISRVINVAAGRCWTLNHTLAILQQITGKMAEPIYDTPRTGDIRHSQADIQLARQLLAFEPKVSFEEGLSRTVGWYDQNPRWN